VGQADRYYAALRTGSLPKALATKRTSNKQRFEVKIEIDFGGKKWTWFFWINILWILGTIGLGVYTFQQPVASGESQFIETMKVVFLSLGGLGVILPTYLSVFHSIENKNESKIENSFQLIERWDNEHLHKARNFTRKLKDDRASLSNDELVTRITNDEELRQSVILVMNYFDNIRVSLKAGRVDKELLVNAMGPVFDDLYYRLLPFIESLGERQKADWIETHTLLIRG